VSAKGLTVLADVATSIEELDKASLARTIAEMEAAIAKLAEGSELDKEITRLDHFRTVMQNLEGTAMH
jgi:F-type H+-transporting ATPase subunit epsilon